MKAFHDAITFYLISVFIRIISTYPVHISVYQKLFSGLHTDEIAQMVELPQSIRDFPHVREMYGTVEWGSKAVTESRMGWFSGFPEELLPLTPRDEAEFWSEIVPYPKAITSIKRSLISGTCC